LLASPLLLVSLLLIASRLFLRHFCHFFYHPVVAVWLPCC
jgi:hypothetical protein